MKHILYLYLLLFSLSSTAQLNLPLKFQEDIVKWSELLWINDAANNNQFFDYSFPIDPIIDNDTIYLFNNYEGRLDNGIYVNISGFTIKKVNLISGLKYWEVQRNYTNYNIHPRRKGISVPQLANGNLLITLYDENKESNGTNSDWRYCYPAFILFDTKTGIAIDSQFVNYSDLTTPSFFSIASPTLETKTELAPRFFYENDKYIYKRLSFKFENNKIKPILQYTHLDHFGKIITSDSIYLFHKYFLDSYRYVGSHGDSTTCATISFTTGNTGNIDSLEVKITQFDHNLVKIDSFLLNQYFVDTFKYIGLQYISPKYFIVLTSLEDFTTLSTHLCFYLFNNKGKLLDKLSYTLKDGIDNGIIYGWLFPAIDIKNKRILLTHSRQNKKSESSFFELRVADADDNTVLKRIHVDGIRDHFRTQWATMMDNGDILLLIEQFNVNDPAASRWYSWIMLDGAKMGIVTKTKDTPATLNQLKLHPNPTTGIVTIDHLDTPAKVDIYDLNGSIVQSVHNVTSEVNIDNLPSGIYILNIMNHQINERHRIIKIE
ncbi:MAG: T9SS type A sorting domain-containing protein [Chitinophagales bacterium]|nr:T9SS type A sorting domain-containing protein [Chitinophagales bacterium]